MKKKLILSLAVVFVLSGCSSLGQGDKNGDAISSEKAKTKAKDFIEENLMAEGQGEAQIDEISEEQGLFKMSVQVGGQTIESYMTKDGKKFFPQAVDMEEPQQDGDTQSANGTTSTQAPQQDMSEEERAEAMVEEGNMLLEQMEDAGTEEERQELEQNVKELEELNEAEDTDSEEMMTKMEELQESAMPLVEEMMEEQQQGQPQQGQPQQGQPQVQPQGGDIEVETESQE